MLAEMRCHRTACHKLVSRTDMSRPLHPWRSTFFNYRWLYTYFDCLRSIKVITLIKIVSSYDFILVIYCELSSIWSCFRNAPHPNFTPHSRDFPSTFVVKLAMLRHRTNLLWKPRDSFSSFFDSIFAIHVTIDKRQTTERHIKTTAERCITLTYDLVLCAIKQNKFRNKKNCSVYYTLKHTCNEI